MQAPAYHTKRGSREVVHCALPDVSPQTRLQWYTCALHDRAVHGRDARQSSNICTLFTKVCCQLSTRGHRGQPPRCTGSTLCQPLVLSPPRASRSRREFRRQAAGRDGQPPASCRSDAWRGNRRNQVAPWSRSVAAMTDCRLQAVSSCGKRSQAAVRMPRVADAWRHVATVGLCRQLCWRWRGASSRCHYELSDACMCAAAGSERSSWWRMLAVRTCACLTRDKSSAVFLAWLSTCA
jgi:hypothetical protein